MPLDGGSRLSDDARMSIAAALRDVLAEEPTQTAVAERLTEHGLPTDQTKVSAWLRGRVPTVEQLAAIEEAFDRPRGWVLAEAGYVDPAGLIAEGIVGDSKAAPTGQRQIRALHAEVRRLRKDLAASEAKAVQLLRELELLRAPGPAGRNTSRKGNRRSH